MNFINDSFLVKCIICIFNWFEKMLSKSKIIQFFAFKSNINIDKFLSESFLYKFFVMFIKFLKYLIYKLKLDNYLRNSMFTKGIFWLCLGVIGVPIFHFYILFAISFMGFLTLIFRYCVDDNFKIRKSLVDLFVLMFLICIILSILFSNNLSNLLTIGLVVVMLILNYFVAVNSVRRKEDVLIILKVFLIVGFLVCLYGIYQYFFGNLTMGIGWIDLNTFNNIDKRMIGPFNNPIILGEYLMFYSLVCFAFVITGKGIRKVIYLVFFLLSCMCVLLTFSRACFLGLVVALSLMFVIYDKKNIIYLIIILLFCLLLFPDNIMGRIFSIGNLQETSISYRLATWDGTVSMLKDYWISGVGYGNDNFLRLITYYSYSYFYIHIEHPHNLFLTLFSSSGIFMLLVFLLMICFYYKRVISIYFYKTNVINKESGLRVFLLALMLGFLGLLIVGMFDNTMHIYSILLLQFMMIGLSVGITNILEGVNDEK